MLLVISFLIYLGLELTPGDAVSFMVPPDQIANLKPSDLEIMRESVGLNDPFFVRYINWLGGVLQGNFGYSLASGVAIKDIVLDRLPATLELSVAALILSSLNDAIFKVCFFISNKSLSATIVPLISLILTFSEMIKKLLEFEYSAF